MANAMHDDPNYKRTLGPDGKEIGLLGRDCGHHCGVVQIGHSGQKAGHCPCAECHNIKAIGLIHE